MYSRLKAFILVLAFILNSAMVYKIHDMWEVTWLQATLIAAFWMTIFTCGWLCHKEAYDPRKDSKQDS